MRIGVHCSIKDGILNAIYEAKNLGCETFQMFSRSPRIWKKKKVKKSEIKKFIKLRRTYNLFPLSLHLPYLPNLATSDEKLYKKSIHALTEDLILANRLEADYLIIHPGSYSVDFEVGIEKIANGIDTVLEKVRGRTMILIENVSGGGKKVGSKFEELKMIIEKIKNKDKIGICFDTAHLHSAGYELSSHLSVKKVLKLFDKLIGLEYLKILHINDSYFPCGSKKDRHQHIGKGYIGLEGFSSLLRDRRLGGLGGILETPKDSVDADVKNLETVRKILNYRNKFVVKI